MSWLICPYSLVYRIEYNYLTYFPNFLSVTVYKEMYECFMNVDGTLQLKKLEKVLQCIGYNPTTEELADYTSTHSTCFENGT